MYDYILTLEDYNTYYGESLTQEEFDTLLFFAIAQFNYIIGCFPSETVFNQFNDITKYNIRQAVLIQTHYLQENEHILEESISNSSASSVNIGRFSMSISEEYNPLGDIILTSVKYLEAAGLYGNRAVINRKPGCGCYV